MRGYLKYLTLVGVLLFHIICTSEVAYSQQLTIAAEVIAAPWSQKDGNGFANDVVRAAFKSVGADIKLLIVPYSRGKEMVESGKVPACFSMSWLPEFQGKVIFSKVQLFRCYVDYFTKKGNSLKTTKESEIKKGTTVGVVIGYEYPPSVYKLRDKKVLIFDESESEEINLKKLALGRIDYALIVHNETKPVELLVARAGVKGKVNYSFRSNIQYAHIGFSTKHPQGKKALEKFNRGMQIISDNGTLKKIEKKWKDIAKSEISKLSAN